jgi:ribosomal protein S18 acetylase RimI-like enzyme
MHIGKPNDMKNRTNQVTTSETAIRVRRADAGDAALLSGLNADVHAVHAEAMPDRFKPPNPETFPPSLVVDLLAKPETLMVLAYLADTPVGYLYGEIMHRPENAVRYDVSMVYIHHISVRPHYRGVGVGKALLAAARATAHAQGITRLGLDVWTVNDAARSFFRSQGFATVREVLYQG